MSDRDIDALIAAAARAGRVLDRDRAELVLLCRAFLANPEIIQDSPWPQKHLTMCARKVLDKFQIFMATGVKMKGFERFIFPRRGNNCRGFIQQDKNE